jgi:hypothetical protein
MIPTTADLDTLNGYVENILSVWRDASDEEYEQGRMWYRNANALATMLADGDTRRGAGVIAALSPQKAWQHNVKLADDALRGEIHGHVRNALEKTERIMMGEDPLAVLPTDSKTWNFFRAIADPEDAEAVVIDRHAHDVAVGERYGELRDRGLSNKNRYATLALAYRLAAQRLGELPSVVQAVTWTVWRGTAE